MFRWRTWLSVCALFSAHAVAAPEIAPITPASRASFDPALVARGAQLSAIGNCHDCHTAEQGKPFAGGRALRTPFGVIYGTNITPDPETGIGNWSEAAFRRALHEGVDREGAHLYPVFPYDHYTKLTDDDVAALYAFIMTRDPVNARTPPNRIAFPYNVRAFIGIWKNLYFEPGRFKPDPAQSAQWNRGAYLAEGAAHCGACHTPRNQFGAEEKERHFAGGETASWHAPALNRESVSPVPWTVEALDGYLRTGLVPDHAIAAGPMATVVRNLSTVNSDDTKAIAVYVASWLGPAQARSAQSRNPAPAASAGAAIYAGACGECHDVGRTASSGGALHLSIAIAPALPSPANLIHLALEGVAPADGEPGRFMPGFAGALTNEQMAVLVQYLRTEFAGKPPWPNVEEEVRKLNTGSEEP
jgi:mono/diheme cytochrome c family protein